MHFRALASIVLPLLTLSAHALPLAARQIGVSNVDNQGLPCAEKGADGLGAALGSGSSSASSSSSSNNSSSTDSSSSGSNVSKGTGKQSDSQGGSQSASSTSSAAKAARTRPCDQGDQSLQSGLQALQTVHLGLQAATKTLSESSGGNANGGANSSAAAGSASDVKAATQRLQQFLDTANLQLQMADAIADDDSFAQPQLASLKKSLADAGTVIKGLKGDASDVKTLTTLQESFRTATGVVQDGISNAVIDCFLPIHTVSG